MLRKIQNALVSVSEKEDLTKVLKNLRRYGVNDEKRANTNIVRFETSTSPSW